MAILLARGRRRARQARRRAGIARHMQRIGGTPRLRRAPVAVLHLPQALMGEGDTTRSAILSALATLVDRLAHTKAEVKLDFSRVRTIYPGGMLLLLAYLELLTEVYPGRIRAVCPRGSKAAQLINHFGFAERLKVPQAGNGPRDPSVTNWRFATGHLAEGDKIARHIDGFAELVGSSMPDGLYVALSEAMINVRHHAYPEGVDIPTPIQRWWLFSSCNPPSPTNEGQLYLAFYDVGVGIPTSMRQRLATLREQVHEGLDTLLRTLGITNGRGQDKQLLRLAIDETRTRTGLPFRGKGLPEMKEFAASTAGGRMTIVSGAAQYSYRAHNGAAALSKCKRPIVGTLILWNLPLMWKDTAP